MQGALITISLILGIPALRAKDSIKTAKLIVYMVCQLKSMARGGVYRQGYRPKDKRKKQLYILQGLTGVSPERSLGDVKHESMHREHCTILLHEVLTGV